MGKEAAISYLVFWLALFAHIRDIVQSAPQVHEVQWSLWKEARGKRYSSVEEEMQRYSVWLDNTRYIEQHNENAEQHGYSLKMNSFGDLVSMGLQHIIPVPVKYSPNDMGTCL